MYEGDIAGAGRSPLSIRGAARSPVHIVRNNLRDPARRRAVNGLLGLKCAMEAGARRSPAAGFREALYGEKEMCMKRLPSMNSGPRLLFALRASPLQKKKAPRVGAECLPVAPGERCGALGWPPGGLDARHPWVTV